MLTGGNGEVFVANSQLHTKKLKSSSKFNLIKPNKKKKEILHPYILFFQLFLEDP